MNTSIQPRKRTQLAVDVDMFRARYGLHITQIAKLAGVSYCSLIDVLRGRSPGVSITPKVTRWMEQYEKDHSARIVG